MTDRAGRIWLLWDELTPSGYMEVRKESDLFCATSSDGIDWSRPRRLPVSSLACDSNPVLQQDRRGVFWLAWISDRGPEASRNVWMSSSPNGVEWSFPRKLVLPETDKRALTKWRRSTHVPTLAFAIDARNVFWLIRQGSLMRSEDAVTWQVDSELAAKDHKWPNDMRPGDHYHLRSDASGRLILTSDFRGPPGSTPGPMAWRRSLAGRWELLGHLSEVPNSRWHGGSAVGQGDGTVLSVAPHGKGLYVREFAAKGPKSEPLCVESHVTKPFSPAITPLPNGRFLVAFGSKEGIVAAVFHPDGEPSGTAQAAVTLKRTEAEGQRSALLLPSRPAPPDP